MTLLIDSGNSRVKFGRWRAGEVVDTGSCNQGDDLARHLDLSHPTDAVACNVAGPRAAQAIDKVCAASDVQVRWLTSTHPVPGLLPGYSDPSSLGDDRWFAMAGGRVGRVGPVCVVDCGTATTLDLIDREGQHRGGLILPGIATMRDALHRRAHGLTVPIDESQSFALSTDAAIAAGTLTALVGGIDRALNSARKMLGDELVYVVTGGESALIAPALEHPVEVDASLVLRGLAFAAELK
ncbi:MAG: type III pantothenate kinase [Pseudomonadota bacterium]